MPNNWQSQTFDHAGAALIFAIAIARRESKRINVFQMVDGDYRLDFWDAPWLVKEILMGYAYPSGRRVWLGDKRELTARE